LKNMIGTVQLAHLKSRIGNLENIAWWVVQNGTRGASVPAKCNWDGREKRKRFVLRAGSGRESLVRHDRIDRASGRQR
jgi:hypothetical protein